MPDLRHPAAIVLVVVVALITAAIVLMIFAIPAIQAKRRGYSFFIWLLAGLLVHNPIYLLVVLATAPHRTRQKLRTTFAAELDAKIAAAGVPIPQPVRPVTERSLGDLATIDPATTASRPPSERSLGDEETRG
jgi:hypothetical protein